MDKQKTQRDFITDYDHISNDLLSSILGIPQNYFIGGKIKKKKKKAFYDKSEL